MIWGSAVGPVIAEIVGRQRLYDVWHQWRPVVFVERSLGEDGKTMDFYKPAVTYRGQVAAFDGAHAIALAKSMNLTQVPLVKEAAHG